MSTNWGLSKCNTWCTGASVATKLQRPSFFEDFWAKIHLHLCLWSISNFWRIFKASKVLGQRSQRFRHNFEGKLTKYAEILWMKIEKTSQILIEANIFHNTYFSDCIFSFIFWQKYSILWISLKKFLSSKVFEIFWKFWRIFVFVFILFSEPEDSLSLVYFQSLLQHWQKLILLGLGQYGPPSVK